MWRAEAREVAAAVARDVEEGIEAILNATEAGLRALEAGREDAAREALLTILQACALQDMAGQRLARLDALISTGEAPPDGGGLLNGPALRGEGLDQAAADRLFDPPT